MQKRPPQRTSGFRLVLLLGLLAWAAVACACGAPPAPADPQPSPITRTNGLLIAFRDNAPLAARVECLKRFALRVDPEYAHPHLARVQAPATVQGSSLASTGFLGALRSDPAVRVVEPNYEIRGFAAPNDPRFGEQYALHNTGQTGGTPDADIDAPEAWDIATGSRDIIVAVLDSGVDYNHDDLRDNILRASDGSVVGIDRVNDDSDPMDDNGHGTHIAGIIGARGNNGLGVTGVCHTVRIMPVKLLDSTLNANIADAIECIDFAVANGAKVINASFGGAEFSQLLLEAIHRARDAGVLFVAAAGNSGANNDLQPIYPASFNRFTTNLVSVAGTDDDDLLAPGSNYGSSSVDLAAPGVSILSTVFGSYELMHGTSMSAGFVSGAAALLLAQDPRLNVVQLRSRLLSTTDRHTSLLTKVRSAGRLNVHRALLAGVPVSDNLSALSVAPATVTGGVSAIGTVRLTAPAAAGGSEVLISTSAPGVVTAPQSVIVPMGALSTTFTLATTVPAASTSVTVTATRNTIVKQAPLLVLPTVLSSFSISPRTSTGGATCSGAITLSGPAPEGGAVVTLTSSNRDVLELPTSLTIPAGETTAFFQVKTAKVKTVKAVSVRATFRGVTRPVDLTVLPPALSTLKLKPARVTAGSPATGAVSIAFNAPAEGVTIGLASSNPRAATTPGSVFVPRGQTSASFKITTLKGAASSVTISAVEGETTKQATLSIKASAASRDTTGGIQR